LIPLSSWVAAKFLGAQQARNELSKLDFDV
jgi:hypothetical protein